VITSGGVLNLFSTQCS